MAGKNDLPTGVVKQGAGKETGGRPSEDKMAEMISRLHLTAEESDALEVADDIEEGLATSDSAIIGKVLSQGVLHIQTIMSALKPAWGNPKGLTMKSVGDNLFIAEFGLKRDRDRVLEGSPWTVGKRAVLTQEFDASMRPGDIHFEEMSIWVRIKNLPFGLMNGKWGYEIANKVGTVEKLDLDDQNRAWGPYLRAKVRINIAKPLRRGVSIFSTKRQRSEWYEVCYERLPNYCYACGIIGHSSIECPTPADRDENGLLPYSTDLRAQVDRKKNFFVDMNSQGSASIGKNNTDNGQGSEPTRSNTKLSYNQTFGTGVSREQNESHSNDDKGGEDTLPSRMNNIKGAILNDSPKHDIPTCIRKEISQENSCNSSGQGKKRKPFQSSEQGEKDLIMEDTNGAGSMEMALVAVQPTGPPYTRAAYADDEPYEEVNEQVKRQRKEYEPTLSISAAAGTQPRRKP